jgi:phosphoheptose isomerase
VIDSSFTDALETMKRSHHRLRGHILEAAQAITDCFTRGGKVLICGNGGSSADAQHFVAELVGRFKCDERPGLPAVALCADTSVLTAWSNDVGYDDAFARQVQALGRPGDILIGISTSGRARNVIRALEVARDHGLTTIGVLGRDGGTARRLTDYAVVVPSADTQRIQEVQSLAIHVICELIEDRLFGVNSYRDQTPARMRPANVREFTRSRARADAPVSHRGGKRR